MLLVGLTGGIGSGKTTVCRVFASLGVPVYDSDTNAKLLMSSDPQLIAGIKALLGGDAYTDGVLNRKFIADKIFNDKGLLARMNSIVHPAVMRDFAAWAEDMRVLGVDYVIQENAILFEGGFDSAMDYTVTVSAPLEQRIERVSLRNNIPADKVRERVVNQMTDEEREGMADYVLVNEEEDMLLPQILRLHDIFIEAGRKI